MEKVTVEMQAVRQRLVDIAAAVCTEHWATATAEATRRQAILRYGPRCRDERHTGRGVRVLWGQVRWFKDATGKNVPRFRDITTPAAGRYNRGTFRGAEEWEVALIMETEASLLLVRRALKAVGEELMRLPAVDTAVAQALKLGLEKPPVS